MTITQQARLAGFRAQLAVRGRTLTLQPSGPAFPALLQPAVRESADYQLAEETTVTDIASILRDDMGPTVITPGAILTEGSAQYRSYPRRHSRAQRHRFGMGNQSRDGDESTRFGRIGLRLRELPR